MKGNLKDDLGSVQSRGPPFDKDKFTGGGLTSLSQILPALGVKHYPKQTRKIAII